MDSFTKMEAELQEAYKQIEQLQVLGYLHVQFRPGLVRSG